MNKDICVCTPMCEEDAKLWLDQYLANMELHNLPFAVYFDNCSADTVRRVRGHRLFFDGFAESRPMVKYCEQHRQRPLDLAQKAGFKLALVVDVDELIEWGARPKLDRMLTADADSFKVHWVNMWGDRQHVRMDNPSNPFRVRANRLDRGCKWVYKGNVVDPYNVVKPSTYFGWQDDLVLVNCGLMTKELRESHRDRWRRLYQQDQRPHYWDWLLNESNTPTIVPNTWTD